MDEQTKANQVLKASREDIKKFSLDELRTAIRITSQNLIDSQYDETTKRFNINILMMVTFVNEYRSRLKGGKYNYSLPNDK